MLFIGVPGVYIFQIKFYSILSGEKGHRTFTSDFIAEIVCTISQYKKTGYSKLSHGICLQIYFFIYQLHFVAFSM